MPSDAATVAQPEAASTLSAVVPQIDRTRKPINNQKPESLTIEKPESPTIEKPQSPTIETQELPIKPVRI